MHAQPPAVNSVILAFDCPWLPPIRFGEKPYAELCRTFDEALRELESRFPSHRPLLTLEGRNKQLKHRPK